MHWRLLCVTAAKNACLDCESTVRRRVRGPICRKVDHCCRFCVCVCANEFCSAWTHCADRLLLLLCCCCCAPVIFCRVASICLSNNTVQLCRACWVQGGSQREQMWELKVQGEKRRSMWGCCQRCIHVKDLKCSLLKCSWGQSWIF